MNKFIFLCFLFLFAAPVISLGTSTPPTNRRSKPKKGVTDSIYEFFETLSDYGGETASNLFYELYNNLQNTANLARSLSSPAVIDSINFVIRTSLQSFREATGAFNSVTDKSNYVTAANLEQFLEAFQTKLMTKLRSRENFSPIVESTLESNFPQFTDAIVQTYANIYNSIGMGLTFSMVIQGVSMLAILERPEYVNTKTFEHFASMPTQVTEHLEQLVGSLVSAEQIDMAHTMLKMYLAQVKPREHEEL